MKKNSKSNKIHTIEHVAKNRLCIGCGVCKAACAKNAISISMDQKSGLYKPLINYELCNYCGSCLKVCPGIGLNVANLNIDIFSKQPDDVIIGNYKKCYIGYSNDYKIRYNASSGGLVSTFIIYLLEKKVIDGAMVVGYKKCDPINPVVRIARTRKEILSASGSKYYPVNLSEAIQEIIKSKGQYAFVGLPCHIQAIRKFERINKILNDRIVIHLGLFCGFLVSSNGIKYFLKKNRISLEDTSKINYRANGWPGNLVVETKSGGKHTCNRTSTEKSFLRQSLFHSAFHFDFVPYRCLSCFDTFNQFADISFGDAWLPEIKANEKIGMSHFVIRTKIGEKFLNKIINSKLINIEEKSINSLKCHNLFLINSINERMKMMSLLNMTIPSYIFGDGVCIPKSKSFIKKVINSFTFLFFVPSFFSHNRKLWWLVMFFAVIRHFIISKVMDFLKEKNS